MSAKEWEQNRSNGPSHMINISAMLKGGKENFESLLLQNQLTDSLDTQYVALCNRVIPGL